VIAKSNNGFSEKILRESIAKKALHKAAIPVSQRSGVGNMSLFFDTSARLD
jgi:hypothetical protein